ncbi:MAG: methyltransferase domain-containing protein [Candidatus Magasanikbacteria bacterium]|jgi:SAM-dependent methyltransferase|nr:methyltransferase domain-containing protein [Candidatus Magasanikbacteria bacterium]
MSLAYKISSWNRKRKWQRFVDVFPITPEWRILDVGFNAVEYSDTDNFLEKNYPYPKQITALGIDDPKDFQKKYPQVKAIQYDGNIFPFSDTYFDVCWSNAVIEHVGNFQKQIDFLREIKRTSRHAYITTPNKLFPIEVHTRVPLLHFFPKSVFDAFLRLIKKEWATGSYMSLLSKKELELALKKAGIENFYIYQNKLFGFTLDFVVVW